MNKHFVKIDIKDQTKISNDFHENMMQIRNETTGVVSSWDKIVKYVEQVAQDKQNFYREKSSYVLKTEQAVS